MNTQIHIRQLIFPFYQLRIESINQKGANKPKYTHVTRQTR